MKRYLRTASRGLTLGAGLAVLWLILGSHALFFTACTSILYSVVLPIVMMRSIDAAGVSGCVQESCRRLQDRDCEQTGLPFARRHNQVDNPARDILPMTGILALSSP